MKTLRIHAHPIAPPKPASSASSASSASPGDDGAGDDGAAAADDDAAADVDVTGAAAGVPAWIWLAGLALLLLRQKGS